jgi:hypothetical protein
MRDLPKDIGGAWLKGPRQMRFITDVYAAFAPQASFETAIEFPANFDALVFVKHVSPVR